MKINFSDEILGIYETTTSWKKVASSSEPFNKHANNSPGVNFAIRPDHLK